ncbi:MAG: toxin-antitoxin system YwqK family antitoxin [Pirellulales bacterium]
MTRFISRATTAPLLAVLTIMVGAASPARAQTSQFHRGEPAERPSSPPAWLRPQPTAVPLQPTPAVPVAKSSEKLETVVERYDSGEVKVERQVKQDALGDFVNHGKYRFYGLTGNVLRQGRFEMGKLQGTWQRAFKPGEYSLFADAYEDQFEGPFISQADFDQDKLHGLWTITDRKGQKIIEWPFENGTRHGLAKWWYPNGQLRRTVQYDHDVEQGEVSEWNADGRLEQTKQVGGGPQAEVVWHSPGHKAAEGTRLALRREVIAQYDWWNGKVSIEFRDDPGPDPLHGVWTFYYPNGQLQMRGEYDHDQPVGTFTWWHANGCKQAEGSYENGYRVGLWTRWHDNGRRQSQGEFFENREVGQWTDWNPDGSVLELHDYGQGEELADEASPAELVPADLQDARSVQAAAKDQG